MATRMTTLLYGEKPCSDVEAGNRADLADAGPSPQPDVGVVAAVDVSNLPPMRPKAPTPQPWIRPPFALRALMLGVAAAAAVFAGLALFGVAIAWSYAMTLFVQLTLMILGGLFVAAGVAYVASAHPETA